MRTLGGRKQPPTTEREKEREYRLQQKRGRGDSVVGDEAGFLDEVGAPAEVAKEREAWKAKHDPYTRGAPELPRKNR